MGGLKSRVRVDDAAAAEQDIYTHLYSHVTGALGARRHAARLRPRVHPPDHAVAVEDVAAEEAHALVAGFKLSEADRAGAEGVVVGGLELGAARRPRLALAFLK